MASGDPQLVDHESAKSLTDQLVEILRTQITAGELKPGERVPSTRTIARQHRVSLGTAANAVAALVRKGLVRTQPQKGAFVAASEEVRRRPRTGNVGFIACQQSVLEDPYSAEVFRAITNAAHAHGVDILMVNSKLGWTTPPDHLRSLLRAEKLDALIYPVAMKTDLATVQLLQKHHVPFVILDAPEPDAGGDAVMIDNLRSCTQVMDHLLGLGHKRIAFIGSTSSPISMQERFDAYQRALKRAGLPFDERLVCDAEYGVPAGHEAMQTLLAAEPTAVFAADDFRAYGALLAIRAAGLRVPEDVSVAGFGDTLRRDRNFLEHAVKMTTTDIDFEFTGRAAMEHLMARVSGQDGSPARLRTPATLVPGNTTAQARERT